MDEKEKARIMQERAKAMFDNFEAEAIHSTTSNDIDDDGDGYTEKQGDCNDNDSSIYPGAPETCGDGIDQDCDGSDLECAKPWWWR